MWAIHQTNLNSQCRFQKLDTSVSQSTVSSARFISGAPVNNHKEKLTRDSRRYLETVDLSKRNSNVLGLAARETSGYTTSSHCSLLLRFNSLRCPYPKKPASRPPYMLAIMLELFVLSHIEDHFFWQYLHVPQAIWNETTTLSPCFRLVTLGPTRSMTPLIYSASGLHSDIVIQLKGRRGDSHKLMSEDIPFLQP
jgi:hypothetical protein